MAGNYGNNTYSQRYSGQQHPSPPSDSSPTGLPHFTEAFDTSHGVDQSQENHQQFGNVQRVDYMPQQPYLQRPQSNPVQQVYYMNQQPYLQHPQPNPVQLPQSNAQYLMKVLKVPPLYELPIYQIAVSKGLEGQVWQVFEFMGNCFAMQDGVQTTKQEFLSTGPKSKNNGGIETTFTTLYKILDKTYIKASSRNNNPTRTQDKNPNIKKLTSAEKLKKTIELSRKVCLFDEEDLIALELLFHLQIGCKAASKSRTNKDQFVCNLLNENELLKELLKECRPDLFKTGRFKTHEKLPFRNVKRIYTKTFNEKGQEIWKWEVRNKAVVKDTKKPKSKRKALQQDVNDQSSMEPVASTSYAVENNPQNWEHQSHSNQQCDDFDSEEDDWFR